MLCWKRLACSVVTPPLPYLKQLILPRPWYGYSNLGYQLLLACVYRFFWYFSVNSVSEVSAMAAMATVRMIVLASIGVELVGGVVGVGSVVCVGAVGLKTALMSWFLCTLRKV